MLKRAFVFMLALVLSFGSLTSIGLAQGSTTGKLVGTVSGPDGVIGDAVIVLSDNQTRREQTITSNSEGGFSFSQLNVGTYTVKVTAPGFKTFTATDVKIDVGKEYNLNVSLEVGDISESVTVMAGEEVINSTNAELSNTVSTRKIQELPLNGRNPLALVGLQAGTSNASGVTTINGQRASFTNITRDGINIQDNFIRANAVDFVPDRPNVDDVSEFTIITQNAGAELGAGSSQVQLVTPRGSNQFHGGVFLYNRNSALAANTFFNNRTGIERPYLNRNQFGGSLSGPIIKEKLFFFGAYEGFRLRQSVSPVRTILLPQARNGVFTYIDNSGVRRTINVLQAAGVSADQLIQSRILGNVPDSGNTTDAGDQLNTTGFRLSRTTNQDREAFTTRGDYEINQNNSLNVTYSYKKEFLQRNDVDAQQGGNAAGFTTTPFGFQDAHTHFMAGAWRKTISDRISNEVRGGFQFSDPRFGANGAPEDFFIQIPVPNNVTFLSNPEPGFQTQGRDTQIWNIQDNIVWLAGQHSLRFGGQAQFFRINPYGPGAFGASTIPTYVLGTNPNTPSLTAGLFPGGISTAQLNNANALLAILGGIVGTANQTFNVTSQTSGFVPGVLPNRNLHYENFSFYFSDQWRLRPTFTLNLGVRYEIYRPVREPNGLALEPEIRGDVVSSILDPNGRYVFVGTNAGGNNMFKTDWNNIAPVISFAWSPQFENGFLKRLFPGDGRTVIRGGYRESYVNDEFVRAADNALIGNQGLSSGVTLANINARFGSLPTVPTPEFQVPRTYAQNNLLAARFGTVFAIDPDLKVPRTQEYNFGIEREIGFDTALEIRYVGSRSNNLVRGLDFNQVDIFNNGFVEDFLRARSNLVNFGNPACANPATGCQPLTVFPNLGSGGLLNNATIRNQLIGGTPADLAIIYIQNNLAGTVPFLRNPNTGVVDLLTNSARFNYNALQVEVRRRFTNGFVMQANYTFSKALADAAGVGQTRFDPPLDINNIDIEYGRAPFDQSHVFNLNMIYELPFGSGKPFLNDSGWLNRVVGGWQVTSIVRWDSGAPISILDPRGTYNRAGRSAAQTALTSLNKDELKGLVGIFDTPCGIFYIDPRVINIDPTTCTGTGRGSEGFGTTPFAGQVFFSNAPGQTSGLERAFLNGPQLFNWDASIIKNIQITEGKRLQFRVEAFNVINNVQWNNPTSTNIASTSFGRITGTGAPRIIQLVGRFQF